LEEVANLKSEITRLKTVMTDAKVKQSSAQGECKRIEKEISDFKSNKDLKLKEIKASQSVA
jgi:structural maintenance of chromosome 2